MTATHRVVLDTNVVLSALIFTQGRLAPLRPAWQQARFRPLASRVTVTELARALSYPKFGLTQDEQRELLADYLPYCSTVRMPATPPPTPECRDSHDVPFLQLALVGKADFLVTGDRDLLTLSGSFGCSIIAPDKLLQVLAAG